MTGGERTIGQQVADLAARVTAAGARALGVPADVDPPPPARAEPEPAPVYPSDAQVLAHLRAGGGRDPVPPQVAADVERLVDDLTGPPAAPEALRIDADDWSGWRSLHVRNYRRRAGELVDALAGYVPAPGPFALVHAHTSMLVALAGLRAATELTDGYRERSDDLPPAPPPAEIAPVLDQLAETTGAAESLVRAVQARLGDAYHAAAAGHLVAPPGATASVEVQQAIRDLLAAERALDDARGRLIIASGRLGRITPRAAPGP